MTSASDRLLSAATWTAIAPLDRRVPARSPAPAAGAPSSSGRLDDRLDRLRFGHARSGGRPRPVGGLRRGFDSSASAPGASAPQAVRRRRRGRRSRGDPAHECRRRGLGRRAGLLPRRGGPGGGVACSTAAGGQLGFGGRGMGRRNWARAGRRRRCGAGCGVGVVGAAATGAGSSQPRRRARGFGDGLERPNTPSHENAAQEDHRRTRSSSPSPGTRAACRSTGFREIRRRRRTRSGARVVIRLSMNRIVAEL